MKNLLFLVLLTLPFLCSAQDPTSDDSGFCTDLIKVYEARLDDFADIMGEVIDPDATFKKYRTTQCIAGAKECTYTWLLGSIYSAKFDSYTEKSDAEDNAEDMADEVSDCLPQLDMIESENEEGVAYDFHRSGMGGRYEKSISVYVSYDKSSNLYELRLTAYNEGNDFIYTIDNRPDHSSAFAKALMKIVESYPNDFDAVRGEESSSFMGSTYACATTLPGSVDCEISDFLGLIYSTDFLQDSDKIDATLKMTALEGQLMKVLGSDYTYKKIKGDDYEQVTFYKLDWDEDDADIRLKSSYSESSKTYDVKIEVGNSIF